MTQIELENLHLQNQCARKYLGRTVDEIDWERRRYEIAKEMLPYLAEFYDARNKASVAKEAVKYADALIGQLKGDKK